MTISFSQLLPHQYELKQQGSNSLGKSGHKADKPKADNIEREARLKELNEDLERTERKLVHINKKIQNYESRGLSKKVRDIGGKLGVLDSIEELMKQKRVLESDKKILMERKLLVQWNLA